MHEIRGCECVLCSFINATLDRQCFVVELCQDVKPNILYAVYFGINIDRNGQ